MFEFPTKTLDTIKRLLLRQKKEVEENLTELEEDDPAKSPALAESSEPGTDSYIAETHNKTLVLLNQLQKIKIGIKQALLKISHGNYGKCEKCGKPIGIQRLLIIPTAQYCLICSKKTSK